MADPNPLDPTPAPPPPALQFDASPGKAIIGTVIGAALILLTGFSTILTMVRAHDIIGILKWLQATDGVTFIASASFVAAIGWRVWSTIRKNAKAVMVARLLPDKIAVVNETNATKAAIDATVSAPPPKKKAT